MHYYGTRLSENISRREPEGYLLCLNVPVARTGTQEYLPQELALPGGGEMIQVYRPEDEVFSPETIASFEGMPVTNDHPPDGVDIGNIRALQKGHAHNVRRGSGEESDLLLADLIITDPELIDLILDGKREISCGYTYELHEENGQFIQRKIRGNHVAVVDAGRAGPRVSIKDHKVYEPERRKTSMKKSLSKILARMAKDGDIETVAEIIEEMIEPEAAAEATEVVVVETPKGEASTTAGGGNLVEAEVIRNEQAPQGGAATIENAETTVVVDESTLADIVSRLDKLIELLTPAPAADEDPVAEEVAEVIEEALEAAEAEAAEEPAAEILSEGIRPEEVAEIVGEILDPAETGTGDPLLDECEEEQEVLTTGDALRAALTAVRPALAKMPRKQRQRVCADIAARMKRGGRKPAGRRAADAGTYAALSAMRRSAARPDEKELGRRIMASRNINCRK